jgi:hypothetical protein
VTPSQWLYVCSRESRLDSAFCDLSAKWRETVPELLSSLPHALMDTSVYHKVRKWWRPEMSLFPEMSRPRKMFHCVCMGKCYTYGMGQHFSWNHKFRMHKRNMSGVRYFSSMSVKLRCWLLVFHFFRSQRFEVRWPWKIFLHVALLLLRVEEEIHAFQKKFLDANRDNFAHSHIARDENEHHQTLFIHLKFIGTCIILIVE